MSFTWDTEFGPEFAPPTAILRMVGQELFEDLSWHNDSCPKFGLRLEELEASVWLFCQPEDVSRREWPECPRYAVMVDDDLHSTGENRWGIDMLETEDAEAAIVAWTDALDRMKKERKDP